MNMGIFNALHSTVKKVLAAALLAAVVTATPMFMDTLLETDMTAQAVAGRPQAGGGEY